MASAPNIVLNASNAPLVVTNLHAGSSSTFGQLPLGTVGASATGELGMKVIVVGSSGSGATNVAVVSQVGAANIANNQVTIAATATTFVAARATRRSVTLKNMSTSTSMYVGVASVTVANGFELKAGESISVDWTGLIQGISATGSIAGCYMETYD